MPFVKMYAFKMASLRMSSTSSFGNNLRMKPRAAWPMAFSLTVTSLCGVPTEVMYVPKCLYSSVIRRAKKGPASGIAHLAITPSFDPSRAFLLTVSDPAPAHLIIASVLPAEKLRGIPCFL